MINTMTVGELIAKLETYDKNILVYPVGFGCCCSFDPIYFAVKNNELIITIDE